MNPPRMSRESRRTSGENSLPDSTIAGRAASENTSSGATLSRMESPPPRSTAKSFVLVSTCTFAMVVNSANNTAVAISLSTIERALHIREAELQWLVSGYPLSSGCLLILLGRFADLHGRKRTFIGGSLWLIAFTLGCGFSQDFVTLNILRGLQGVGAAATIPACLGILAHAFSSASRARSLAFASFAAGAPLGAALGMALGGALVQTTAPTWRTPFFFESGLSILCLLGGLVSIDADIPSTETDKRIDWLGAFLVTAGLVLIVFVLGQGENAPQRWRTGYIIALLITGVLFIVLFLFWQGYLERIHHPSPKVLDLAVHQSEKMLPTGEENAIPTNRSWLTPPPLMKLSLWRRANGRLSAMMWIAFLTWCAFLSWGFWAQLYYQNYLHLSPVHTCIRLLPMFVSGIICNIIVASIVTHVPVLYLIVIGTLGSSLACLFFAIIMPSAPYWAFGFPGAIVAVIGADFVFAAGTLYVASVVDPNEQSLAGGLFQTMTQLGTSVGLTVTTVIFNRVTSHDQRHSAGPRSAPPRLESYQAAQWGCFALGMLATLLAVVFFRGVGVIGKKKMTMSG